MDGAIAQLLSDLDALYEHGPTCGRCGHPLRVHAWGPCHRDIPAAALLFRCPCEGYVSIEEMNHDGSR